MLKFKNFLLLIIILFSNSYLSNIWIEPKDELKIKKLELYSAKNNINIRTTTYPLNLNSLKNSTIYEASFLSDKIELNSLVDKFFKKTERFNSSISLNAFSDDLMIKNSDDNWTSKNSIILKNSYTNKNFSLNLNLHFIEDSYDEKKIIYNDGAGKCMPCHGIGTPYPVQLQPIQTAYNSLFYGFSSAGNPYFDTVNPGSSFLYKTVLGADGVTIMPPLSNNNGGLSNQDIDMIYLWISQGAKNK